jgi:hypothetical protein
MDPAAARALALAAHAGHLTGHGDPLIAHLERVAERVPPDAATTAWLHELGDRGVASVHDLLSAGISDVELAALELLTQADAEDHRLYIQRIARAPGAAGRLARTVKLAELADHLDRVAQPSPAHALYAWAYEQVARGQRRARRRTAEAA